MFKRKLVIVNYPEDCKIIKDFFYSFGVEISLEEAEELWYDFSASQSAGWLNIDSDVNLLKDCFREYVENGWKVFPEEDEEDA